MFTNLASHYFKFSQFPVEKKKSEYPIDELCYVIPSNCCDYGKKVAGTRVKYSKYRRYWLYGIYTAFIANMAFLAQMASCHKILSLFITFS